MTSPETHRRRESPPVFDAKRSWFVFKSKNVLLAARRTLVAAPLALLTLGCEQPVAPPQPPPAEVAALEVRPRGLDLELEYAAQLRGVREVEVRARVSGILLERLYEEGQPVEAGALLFRIDPAPFRAEVERARAEVGVQSVNLERARRERDRVAPLYEQGLASVRERDAALADFEGAQASLAAAEATLNSAELSLSYTEVRAPIAGITSREVRSEGSLVLAGSESSLLTYIVQTDRLYVEFALPESDAALIAADGQAAGLTVRIVDARGAVIGPPAKIEFVSPRIDDATGTLAIRAILDNTDDRLLPGRVVRARIEGVRLPDTFVVPKRAVLHGAQGPFVWLIGTDDTVAAQPVELGASSGNDVAVTAGLAAGNRVVVEGILKVQPGAVVNASPLAAYATDAAAVTAGGASGTQ